MNTQEFITRYNLARNQVRTQLGYIQTEFARNGWPIPRITEWWDLVLGSFQYPPYSGSARRWLTLIPFVFR